MNDLATGGEASKIQLLGPDFFWRAAWDGRGQIDSKSEKEQPLRLLPPVSRNLIEKNPSARFPPWESYCLGSNGLGFNGLEGL